MNKVWGTTLVLVYLVALFATVHYLFWLWQLSVSGAIAFLFAVAFSLIGGKGWVPLSIVALFTIVFPVSVFIAIGIPVYPDIGSTLRAIIEATREHNPLLGLEWFVPLACAGAGLFVARHMRSNTSLNRDARGKAARAR